MANMFNSNFDSFGTKPKKKRQLTPAQKIFAWENKTKKCAICGKRVTKFSDAEFDHKRAYVKGGATNLSNIVITHRACNRLKGKKSLSQIRKELGTAPKKRKKPTKRKKKSIGLFEIPEYKPPKLF